MWGAFLRELWRVQRKTCLLLFWLAGLNLLVYVVLQGWVEPLVTAREHRFIERQAELRQSQQAGGDVGPSETALERATHDLDRFLERIPPHKELTGLIDELVTLATMANLGLNAISYDTKPYADLPFRQYSLTFGLEGTYDQVKRFVHALEQSPRVLTLEDISLQYSEQSLQDGVRLSLRLVTFFRKDDAQ